MTEITTIGQSTKIVDDRGKITYFGPTGTIILDGDVIYIKTEYFSEQLSFSDISNRYETTSAQAYCDYIVENNLIVNQSDVTPPVVKEGIQYQDMLWSGQTTIFNDGDVGWRYDRGDFTPNPPVNPLYKQQLDFNAVNPLSTLLYNNEFGNKNRITDINGDQVYSDPYYIDNLYNKGYYIDFPTAVNFSTAMSNIAGSSTLGFTDWGALVEDEYLSISRWIDGDKAVFNYSPLNISSFALNLWTGSTLGFDTTFAQYFNSYGRRIQYIAKTTTYSYWMVRTHFT